MTAPDDPLAHALARVQARLATGDVELPRFPGGDHRDLLVEAGEHAFVIRRDGSLVRSVPTRDLEWSSYCHRAAWLGVVLLLVSWSAVIARIFLGGPLGPSLTLTGVSAALFMAPLLVAQVVTSRPFRIGPHHPLADRAVRALEALAVGSGESVGRRSAGGAVAPPISEPVSRAT